ncbi:MAG: DsrE family protein [Sulfurimonas sp.]|nr:DsrE family protein [Sulfurimonas sp.]
MKRFIVVLIVFLGLVRADGDMKKAVFDLTTSDLTTFENRMIKAVAFNNSHYQTTFKELDIIVIVHGGAYKFFVKDISKTKCKEDKKLQAKAKEIHERLASLVKTYSVKFLMCGVGMKARNIAKENVLEFVEVVPSAMVGLIDAQNDGYAFVPID